MYQVYRFTTEYKEKYDSEFVTQFTEQLHADRFATLIDGFVIYDEPDNALEVLQAIDEGKSRFVIITNIKTEISEIVNKQTLIEFVQNGSQFVNDAGDINWYYVKGNSFVYFGWAKYVYEAVNDSKAMLTEYKYG